MVISKPWQHRGDTESYLFTLDKTAVYRCQRQEAGDTARDQRSDFFHSVLNDLWHSALSYIWTAVIYVYGNGTLRQLSVKTQQKVGCRIFDHKCKSYLERAKKAGKESHLFSCIKTKCHWSFFWILSICWEKHKVHWGQRFLDCLLKASLGLFI